MSFTEIKYRKVNNDECSLCIPSDQAIKWYCKLTEK